MIFTSQYTVEQMHTDPFGNLKPSAILYFAQEAAGAHCERLGTDYQTLKAKGVFWAVTRHTVQIQRLPVLGQTVTVRTWPMPTTRVAYPRAAEICDSEGNVMIRILSLWVLMDGNKRTMVLPGKSGVQVEGVLQGTELETPRSLIPSPRKNSLQKTVTYSLLDRNGHMNNTRYMDWVADLQDSSFHRVHPVRMFTVCYLSEAREQQAVRLAWELTEQGELFVDAYRDSPTENRERVFSVRVIY